MKVRCCNEDGSAFFIERFPYTARLFDNAFGV
jgi:hypothetical protein